MKEECLFHALWSGMSHRSWCCCCWLEEALIPCCEEGLVDCSSTRYAMLYKSPKANISLNVHLSRSNISYTSIWPMMVEIFITDIVTCIDANQDTLEWSNEPSSRIETDTTSFMWSGNHDCLWQAQSLQFGPLDGESLNMQEKQPCDEIWNRQRRINGIFV